ncbi:MAG TPA: hypothetical protein VKB53_13995 [Gammaproteobacteria bacterium]|jgi:hypothetical protein|nr:hypothetical protein [Gammaproteobacteria bacterium]
MAEQTNKPKLKRCDDGLVLDSVRMNKTGMHPPCDPQNFDAVDLELTFAIPTHFVAW